MQAILPISYLFFASANFCCGHRRQDERMRLFVCRKAARGRGGGGEGEFEGVSVKHQVW